MNAAERLERFLLDGGAQLADGPERGGVAGTLDESGKPAYVYGEITGYYLHWLATPHAAHRDERARNAQAALDWARRRFRDGALPPTRIELGASTNDWRNRAQFCFDLAMLVGGLAAATKAGFIDAPTDVLDRLYAALADFATEDGLVAYRTDDGSTLPPRWSTTNGPFLVKAAARIASAHAVHPLPGILQRAAQAHAAAFDPDPRHAFDDPVHPTLYFLEGHLAFPHADRAGSAAPLRRILDRIDADGSLPESVETAHVRRSDIIAQALRVALLLRESGELDAGDDSVIDMLCRGLAARVRDDGRIAFDPAANAQLSNVWTAMFAQQALAWHAQWRDGEALRITAADIV